jgi:HlyD family secretion protein
VSNKVAFRKLALDRLSSADDLDRVLRVTSLRSWLLLTALCGLMMTAVTWSAVAVVPQKVFGPGILLKSGGVSSVVAPVAGRVGDVSVSVGDTVKEGQVLARIAQPELVDRLQAARIQLANLQQAHALLVASGNRQLRVQVEALEQQAGNLKEAITADEQRAAYFAEKVVSQQQLVNEGRLVRQTLVNTIQDRDKALEEIRTRRTQLTELELRTFQARSELESGVQKSSFAIREAANEVEQLERALTSGAEVRSPNTGRIIELGIEQGAIVARGEPLFSLDQTGRTVAALQALVYVPAKDGKRIAPGMLVQIAPATVRPEEYGFLLGKVTYVSDLPATARGMLRVLKNEALVASLTGATPPHEVHVDLIPDFTESGYRWSSAQGPPVKSKSRAARCATTRSSSSRGGRSRWSFRSSARRRSNRDGDVPNPSRAPPGTRGHSRPLRPGPGPERTADGSGGMRRGVAGDDPGALRPRGAARRAAGGVRRLARRQPRAEHPQGRPRVRAGGQGLPQGAGRADRRAAAVHRALEFQPLPGRRGCTRQARLPQRSRHRPAGRHAGRGQRRLHRRGPDVRPQ